MVKRIMEAGAAAFILAAALHAGAAAAHGKVSLEEDNCVRWAGESAVHLTAYQPQHDPGAQYCTEIPQEGDTYLVIDLVDPALRNMPVGLRVVKGGSGADGETVVHLRASHHPDGVIRGESSLDPGQYTVFITGEGLPPLQYEYSLRVQMINYAKTFRTVAVPLLALLLLALLVNKLRKSEQVRRWWASRRS